MSGTVYVTGAAGFLGRHSCRSFASAGWRVIGIGRGALDRALVPWGASHSVAAEVDLTGLASAHQAAGPPDVIVHAAGTSSVAQSAQAPVTELGNTVGSTAAVVEYMRVHAPRARLVYLSSAAVYGSAGPAHLTVATPVAPISIYGLHKHLAEEVVLGAGAIYGIDVTVVRLFSVYGPGLAKQILWDVVRRIEGGERPLTLSGDGGETRDFLYIEDAVRIVHHLATTKDVPLIVNGGTGTAVPIRQLVGQLLESCDRVVPIEFSGTSRPGDPRHLVADPSYFKGIGFEMETALEAGIRAYAEWAQDQFRREPGRLRAAGA
jgi:UDP-glucose 4-epimerase